MSLNKAQLENLTNEVWKGAISLRGKFKAKDYPTIILPMIMIRRIECVLETNRAEAKQAIIQRDNSLSNENIKALQEQDLKNGTDKASEKRQELAQKLKRQETLSAGHHTVTDEAEHDDDASYDVEDAIVLHTERVQHDA